MEIKPLRRKDWFNQDKFKVKDEIKKKYPNAHFCFIRNDDDRVNLKMGQGYVPIKDEKGEYIQVGDTILMAIHNDDWKDREDQKDKLIKSFTQGAKATFEEKVKDQLGNKDAKKVRVVGDVKVERNK